MSSTRGDHTLYHEYPFWPTAASLHPGTYTSLLHFAQWCIFMYTLWDTYLVCFCRQCNFQVPIMQLPSTSWSPQYITDNSVGICIFSGRTDHISIHLLNLLLCSTMPPVHWFLVNWYNFNVTQLPRLIASLDLEWLHHSTLMTPDAREHCCSTNCDKTINSVPNVNSGQLPLKILTWLIWCYCTLFDDELYAIFDHMYGKTNKPKTVGTTG